MFLIFTKKKKQQQNIDVFNVFLVYWIVLVALVTTKF